LTAAEAFLDIRRYEPYATQEWEDYRTERVGEVVYLIERHYVAGVLATENRIAFSYKAIPEIVSELGKVYWEIGRK